eukprot:gnl/TRDRNA2_/TRDRNA2_44619_c0_seq1.p1 gnl/TRDRNA2_/TRDRNA2_44619_c0~~gnl/TRDRNA2_/TRDRNA2_44619_c0_seq1.p1  ORF type:complete len:352 (+),score=71.48 gnl/TRDRNA2_/TRDRNA2_44619_c0_seq1:67-1122(+)
MQASLINDVESGGKAEEPLRRICPVKAAWCLPLSLMMLGYTAWSLSPVATAQRGHSVADKFLELARKGLTSHHVDLANTTLGTSDAAASEKAPSADEALKRAMAELGLNDTTVNMTEKLDQVKHVMADPDAQVQMANMFSMIQSSEMTDKVKEIMADPAMKDKFEEMRSGGMGAIMKFMNDKEFLKKMGKMMGDAPRKAMAQAAGASPVAPEAGADPLIECARKGDTEQLKAVLKKGKNPNVKDAGGRTALHWAAGRGDKDAVQALSSAGAILVAQDDQASTPLHYAAGYGRIEIVNFFLDSGVLPSLNVAGKSPADVSLMNRDNPIARDEDLMNRLQCEKPVDPRAPKVE